MRTLLVFFLVLLGPLTRWAQAQECSHAAEPVFYEKGGYLIGQIQLSSPFDFFFLVRQRLNAIKGGLLLKAGSAFSVADYNASFVTIRDAVMADSALGALSPVKLAVTTGGLANCREAGTPHTVDIVYNIFSTDPIPAAEATPEQRRALIEQPATTAAENSLQPEYQIVPRAGYDRTRRGFGGADFTLGIPSSPFSTFYLSAQGSSSSKELSGGLQGSAQPGRAALARINYDLGYSFSDVPAADVRLVKGVAQGHFIATSKPVVNESSQTVFRYGSSIQLGNQQTNLAAQSSRYGAIGLYAGVTNTTTYSETAISYAFSGGGVGLSQLDYTRHIGDVTYSFRFPGETHRPWDITLRGTGGGITGGAGGLINDRFFGGNSVTNVIPGDAWSIPTGPLVRSIPAYRFAGEGKGGTAFYSGNFTLGKVIFASPLIPSVIEKTPGFDSAVAFAENSSQNALADDYETGSTEFIPILADFPSGLKANLDAAQSLFASIRAKGAASATVAAALSEAGGQAFLAQQQIQRAINQNLSRSDRAGTLRAWVAPGSRFNLLVSALGKLEPLTPDAAPQLKTIQQSIESELSELNAAITRIDNSPVRAAAEARAQQEMATARAAIQTLCKEVNRYSVSLIGLADIGRLWPDPFGTRYAFGGGGRFSLVNVNFMLGYAVNPNPHRELGQGRGAFLFSITYTNLFR